MTAAPDRQKRKRLATRQKISDTATRLFLQRGFDAVTVDQIAEAADVSRMTVFNHFARKEDMFFDLDDEARGDLLTALRQRGSGISPVESLRRFAHQAVAEQRAYVRFFEPGSDRFLAAVRSSASLLARARAIRDEIADALSVALAESGHRPLPDPLASLAASLLTAAWTAAFTEAYRAFSEGTDAQEATRLLLQLVDRGFKAVETALEGTPYVAVNETPSDR